SGLSQRVGFSASAFSSSSRRSALSQSKMPPQQRQRRSNLADGRFVLCAHGTLSVRLGSLGRVIGETARMVNRTAPITRDQYSPPVSPAAGRVPLEIAG